MKAKLLLLTVGLAAALLITAACGEIAATSTGVPATELAPTANATSEPNAEPTATVTAIPSPPNTLPNPGETGQGKEGSDTPAPNPDSGTDKTPLAQSSTAPVGSPSVQFTSNQQVGIWVTASGEVTSEPDLAILTAGVEATAGTVEEARSQAAQAMSQVMDVLAARAVGSSDIQTRFFNISPEYIFDRDKGRQELVGFRVSNQISVKIRDIGAVGLIIDEVAGAAGDLVRVQGVSFTIEDTQALEIQARENAVQALVAKARQLAELTGVELGKPVFLSESGGFQPRVEAASVMRGFDEAAGAAPPTAISGGELRVIVSVQGVFSIVEQL